ncbi:MAG: hypothetical protein BGO71_10260 [Burkholderiales bacterium 67-32]|nr:MAG: hypothetical protein BGO71_10260 [Burkholderiales bacterium 67-32]
MAPDQIKLRGGWVRCGVCNEVFDSSQSLIELDPAGGTPRPVAAGPASLSEAPAEPHVLRRRGEGLTAPAQDGEEPSFAPESAPPFFALPDVVGNESVDPPTRAPSPSGVESSSVSGDVAPPLASDEGLPSVLRSRRPAPAGLPDEARAEPEVEAERQPAADNLHAPIVSESRPRAQEPRSDEAPDFLDQDVRRRRRRALWLWSLAALIALLVLLAQAAWIFRAEIATRVPMLRPGMERLCQRWQCTVGYPRAPELLVIESSSVEPWSPESPGFAPPIADMAESAPGESSEVVLPTRQLALRMVLRNRATFPQSWPAIELSLMDLSDAVAARRVLLPSVYLSPRDFAQPLGPLQERVLRIPIETIDAHATGYRVAIFYP